MGFPIVIGDFGLTSLYQTVRKLVVTLLLGGVGQLYIIRWVQALGGAFVLATLGLKLAFTNPDKILTSPISEISYKNLKPRIADMPDVVSINCRDKINMHNPVQQKREYWLADQALLNSNCKLKLTDIPDVINAASHDLKYNEVVNMQDVTGLNRVDFSDILDLGQSDSYVPKFKGKTVNFLDKFGDPEIISESEWYTSEPPVIKNRYLRGRTRN
uniref:Uncharacterized protein n=1 Tax=Nitzschia supralitorea TaxID=303403 RepID=A0A8F0WG10_9STRA|nr:hypothetical protein KYU99_pgp071 [Nitzschia supralitorea]QWM93172.1 hypothetical protein [Nitzschia supralitorea]